MNNSITSFVENLKRQWKDNENDIRGWDEEKTKMGIVMPILNQLGWNVFDMNEVHPEYNLEGKKVDFSLRIKNKNKVFIEAKRTGGELDNHQEQLLNYAFKEGVELSILTNGLNWWFYLSMKSASWEQRKFFSINIEQQELDDIPEYFSDFLEKENVETGTAVKNAERVHQSQMKILILNETIPKVWNKLIMEPNEFLVDLISEETEDVCGFKPDEKYLKAFIKRNISGFNLESEMSEPIVEKKSTKKSKKIKKSKKVSDSKYLGKKIIAIEFDNKRYEVKLWKDVLVQLCVVLHKKHKGTFKKVFDVKGKKRVYFSNESEGMWEPREIGSSGTFVETHASSQQIISICGKVLERFDYSLNDLKLDIK